MAVCSLTELASQVSSQIMPLAVQAVCSFQKRQLDIGPIADTVMFFHGLAGKIEVYAWIHVACSDAAPHYGCKHCHCAGLENACDDGAIGRGQFVLFNGASLLIDLNATAIEVSLPRFVFLRGRRLSL